MGHQHENIYGLDIETDTRHDGLDPAVASVVTVALSSRSFDRVFLGDEPALLRALDEHLADLPPGVIATWNGAAFDLPFIADRARILGVDLGLHLCLDPRITLQRVPLPGHAGAYRASWHHHAHLDAYRLYGGPPSTTGRIGAVGRVLGIGGTGRGGHDLTNEALHAHAPSDARLARVLAERRWPAAQRLIDRVEPREATPVTVAAQRVERRARREAIRPAIATI